MSEAVAVPEQKTTFVEDLKALGECPRELWIIYLATFLEYFGVFSFLPTLPIWLSDDFGMSDQRAGWWAATFSTIVTLLIFVVGSVADTFGVRRTLIASFMLAAVARLAMSFAGTGNQAIASLLFFGLAYASVSPVLQTAVQRASTKRTRAFAFSFWYVSFNVGGALAGLLTDFTQKRFIDAVTKKSIAHVVDLPILGAHKMTWAGAMLGVGFISATLGALVTLTLRSDFEHRGAELRTEAKTKTSPLVMLREVVADRAFWRFMLLLVLLCLVRMMFQHMHFTWPKYIKREQGDAFPRGFVWSLNSWCILFLAPIGTAITRRLPPFNVLLFGAFLSALSPFVLCFGSTMGWQLGMIGLLTCGEALWSPRLYEYNVSIAPRGREATYVSLAALPYFLAKFLVGPTSGYLLAAFCPAEGPRHAAIMWAIIGTTTIIGPIGIFMLRSVINRQDPAKAIEAPAT
ncbi:MAG: MFS transporter [Polyangiales bacterium]